MRTSLVFVIIMLLAIPGVCFAQKAGSIVAGFDFGGTSAIGDFKDDSTLNAATGFGLGVELRYTIINNLSIGSFIKYNRFSTSESDDAGNLSYNFIQYGGLARLNIFNLSGNKFYLLGGGGLFKPNAHTWTPDYVVDEPFNSDMFYMGGFGFCTRPYSRTIYELEFRYNTGNADKETIVGGSLATRTHNFDFISVNVKISINSKGIQLPPRY